MRATLCKARACAIFFKLSDAPSRAAFHPMCCVSVSVERFDRLPMGSYPVLCNSPLGTPADTVTLCSVQVTGIKQGSLRIDKQFDKAVGGKEAGAGGSWI